MMTKKRKKDPNDDEKVKFCFRGRSDEAWAILGN